jgi:hypothetical protein
MRNTHLLGGQAANATKATMPCHIWMHEVEAAAIAAGVSGDWLRESEQRARMNRYQSAGEPVWMAADSMIQFWQGRQAAAKDDSESLRRILRDAVRRA